MVVQGTEMVVVPGKDVLGGNFRLPAVVRGVVVARGRVQGTAVEGLHEAAELRPEAVLQGLQVAFLLAPLCPSVLEPDLCVRG